MDYRIKPIVVEGFADATGVCVNAHGAWLGEWDGEQVHIFSDENGDYSPAPADWREHIDAPRERLGPSDAAELRRVAGEIARLRGLLEQPDAESHGRS
jgi:hypothetical protein